MDVASGTPRIGDYELLAKLGEGGMGSVYKARQISLDRVVALKVLPPKAATDAEYLQRFFREARATARLNHPNIVKGITVGTFDGYHIFAMEFVEGTNLKKRITELGHLSEDEVVVIGAAISSALAHAHAAGLIHRDVKPENILMDPHGTPKLADLGLVAMHGDGSLTQAGYAVGTPHYMAPEQVRGEKDIDGRADIYSLGCTLYHAATGKTPFEATTPGVLMVKHLNEKMPHPQSIQPDLSDDFCKTLEHMVARKREDRYADIHEAAQDLQALLEGEAVACGTMLPNKSNFLAGGRRSASISRPRPPTRSVPAAPQPLSEQLMGVKARLAEAVNDPRRRWFVLGGIALASLLLTVLVLKLFGGSDSAPAEQPEQRTPDPVFPQGDPERRLAPSSGASAAPPAQPLAPLKPLFNGRDLSNWREQNPRWAVERGELVGSSNTGMNGSIFCSDMLPAECELVFTAACAKTFHLTLGPNGGPAVNVVHVQDSSLVMLSLYFGDGGAPTRELASASVSRSDQPRQWRVVVKGRALQVYLEGALVTSTQEGVPSTGQSQALGLFVQNTCEVRFRDFGVRDLSRR